MGNGGRMKTNIIKDGENLYIDADGEKILPAAYMSYIDDNADYQQFYKAGYRLFCACVYMGDGYINETSRLRVFNDCVWKSREVYDFSPVYNSVKKIIEAAEEKVYVMLRVNLNTPLWWREENLGELTRLSDGTTCLQSIFSKKWRADAKIFLERLCGYLRSFEFSQNIIAVQLAGMQTEEWFAVRTATGCLDYSAPAKKAFQAWLDKTYSTGSKKARFPTREELALRTQNDVVDMKQCALVNDYLACFNQAFSDTIADLCAYTKKLTDGEMLVGVFYGYIGQLPCEFGHNAVSALLYDSNIDFFASPFAYIDARQTAKDWIYHGAMDSCTLAGKLWFLEADVRTYKTKYLHEIKRECMETERTVEHYKNVVFTGPKTEQESLWVMLRSFAKVLISKHAFWWFDMWGGWYNSPKMLSFMQKAKALYEDDFNKPTKKTSELAVFLDEGASYTVSESYYDLMTRQQLVELGFVGAPYDLYLSSDLDKIDEKKYKTTLRILPVDILQRINLLQNQETEIGKKGKISAGEIAVALRKAGTHVFSEGNIVYANSRFVCVTATKNGVLKLSMPTDCKIKAFTDGKLYKGKEFSFNFQTNQTELFEIIE